jgi:C-8 sterol isomerase
MPEMWYYGEGQFGKRVYRPAHRVYVRPHQARAMNFTGGVWAVEYARGPLPLSVPFGLADELLSTLDFATAVQTLSIYTSLVGDHWRQPHVDGSPPLGRTPHARHGARHVRPDRDPAGPPEQDDDIPSGQAGQ